LPVLPARADAVVELEVVPDARDPRQHVGPLPMSVAPFTGRRSCRPRSRTPRCREHELAARDVDAAAAERNRVQAAVDRADDVLGRVLAGEHERVRHARHREVREALAPAVARERHAHERRVLLVLQVAAEDAVLDQHRALRRRALVVDVERAAPRRDRAVVDDGAELGRDARADAVRERRRALAVEVAFEAVPTASWSRMPGHPGPSTTFIVPAAPARRRGS
jgi:hypothetical protein